MNKSLPAASGLLCALLLVGATIAGCGAAEPVISSISPTSGSSGSAVAIRGNGFGKTQGTNKVLFQDTEARVASWSDTGIAVKVPADLKAGSYMVKVVLGEIGSNQVAFKVTTNGREPEAVKSGEIEHNTPVQAMLAYLKARGESATGYTFAVNAVSKSDPTWKIDVSWYTGNPQPGFWLLHKVNGTWQVLAYGTDWNPQQLGAPADLEIAPVNPPSPTPPAKPATQAEAIQVYLAAKNQPVDNWALTVRKTSTLDDNWEIIHGVRNDAANDFLVVWNNMLGNWECLADGGPPWPGVQFKGEDVPADLNR